jgi:hypothetical protein
MHPVACLLASTLFTFSFLSASGQDKTATPPKKPADGIYAVLRESIKEKEILPLKDGEALVMHHHRYLKNADKEPPRYVVVRPAPDVRLELEGAPKAVKDGEEVISILLKLRPKAVAALERLTTDQFGRHITIVVGGEVVTMHKIRDVLKAGEVQITSCAAGAAKHLLEQLQAQQQK